MCTVARLGFGLVWIEVKVSKADGGRSGDWSGDAAQLRSSRGQALGKGLVCLARLTRS